MESAPLAANKIIEDELEDGEVSSDSECEIIIDYEELSRPLFEPLPSDMKLEELEDEKDYDSFYEDSSNSSSSDSSDSESSTPRTRYKFANESSNATTIKKDLEPKQNNNFSQMSSQFQSSRRRVNNIWADLLTEESVNEAANCIKNIGVGDSKSKNNHEILVERGPESFSVKRKIIRKRERKVSESSISSGGLSPSLKDYARIKTGTRDWKIKPFDELHKMERRYLVRYICSQLKEKKVHLIISAYKVLGRRPVINLFRKTMKIEHRGGIMTKDGSRRRTPGGVFLFLMSKDPKTSNKSKGIFKEEEKKKNKLKKKRCLKSLKKKRKRKSTTTTKVLIDP